ncbi:MAG: cupin domain-containing protein [Gammaproteobacteria bacterium]|nr:MAG: cupin domain-containing protein [Gammaproteobacteria bacterium]
MKPINIYESIPENLDDEVFQDIFKSPNVRVERIISRGQTSAQNDWYDQEENEWVMVLAGHALLEFENNKIVALKKGDYLNLPAHCKHRVKWTDPAQLTIWLAIFYK